MRSFEPDDIARTYRDVLDALPIVSFMARVDGSVSYVSRQWRDLTGLAREAALDLGYLATIHPDHLPVARIAWAAATGSESPYRNEFAIRFGDGSYRWVRSEATPLRDPQTERVVGWFGTLTDVDDRRRADQALHDSEARHRAFSAALPGMTWSASPAGAIDFVGGRYAEDRGVSPDSALGDGWLQMLHPDDREATRARWQASLASGAPYEHSFRVRVADGSYRWQLVRALPQHDDDGSIARWIGVNIDIQEQRLADEARERFVALAENSNDFIATADFDGTVTYVNEAGRKLLELGDAFEASGRRLSDLFAPLDRGPIEEDILPLARADGRFVGDVRLVTAQSGTIVPVTANVFRLSDRAGKTLGIAALAHDKRERNRIERGLRLLSRTGAAALDSLDYAATLRNIALAFVEEYASYCVIDALDAQQRWERTAVHRDPALQRMLSTLSEPTMEHPIARALYSGESSVVRVDETWARAFGAENDRIEAVRALDVRSFVTVPIFTPLGDVVGALTAALDRSDQCDDYRDDDLAFVEEVGRRAGAAFANARLYERERRIAVELQSASLPTTLPRPPGLELDAEYRPGSSEATIGGDWYDAFELDDGRVAITVGDVVGHGLHAAVLMTKLRQAMQSAAMLSPDPGAMLTVADKTLRLIDPDAYATAIAAIYDRGAQTLSYASAGHPGPSARLPDGEVVDLTRSGLMLGLRTGDDRDVHVAQTPPDSLLVFYTDGLIEATRDVEEGQRRLTELLANDTALRGANPARRVVEAVLAGADAADDIAVLVARVAAQPAVANGGIIRATIRAGEPVEAEIDRMREAIDAEGDPRARSHLQAKLQILKIDLDAKRRRRERDVLGDDAESGGP